MVVHQITMNTSLPFVHTARRFYRLNNPMRILDVPDFRGQLRKVRSNGGYTSLEFGKSYSSLII